MGHAWKNHSVVLKECRKLRFAVPRFSESPAKRECSSRNERGKSEFGVRFHEYLMQ